MKKRWLKKSTIIILIIFLVIFLMFIFYRTNCKNDIGCFNKQVSKCSIPAKVIVEREGNIFEYKSKWSVGENCNINVKMIKVGSGFRKELAKEVDGKSMTCKISKEGLKNDNFDEITDLVEYCSGGLKEGIYKVIIKNIYTIVLKNMDEFVDDIENASKGII